MGIQEDKLLEIFKEFNIAHKHLTEVIRLLKEVDTTSGGGQEVLTLLCNNADIKLADIRKIVDQKSK